MEEKEKEKTKAKKQQLSSGAARVTRLEFN
jgi:hypothetical protein